MANDIANTDTRPSLVEIASGKLRGADAARVYAFKGVPYGASCAGRNRFMAPQPPQPWVGVRDAFAYAGHARNRRTGRNAGQNSKPFSARPTRRRRAKTA